MLLALDVGNTNTVLGLFRLDSDKPELAAHWRITTHRSQTVDEYGVFFVNLFEMHGMKASQVTHIIISSVGVTEDRKALGLVLDDTVLRNTTLANLAGVSTRGVIDANRERRVAEIVQQGFQQDTD